MDLYRKFDRIVEKATTYFCSFLFVVIVLIGLANVFFRYVLNNSLPWAEESMRYLCIWMVFVGSSLTVRSDGHVAIDIVQSLIKKPTGKIVVYTATRVIAALSMLVLFPYSITLIEKMGKGMTATTRVPMYVVYLAVPVGIICMLLAFVHTIPERVKKLREEEVHE